VNLIEQLERQRRFSERTFGPGPRTAGVVDHIRKELTEVTEAAQAGDDTLPEWVDVIILGLDGAWRTGATSAQICEAIAAKQERNERRTWPDWRTAEPGKAIEHDRTAEKRPQVGDLAWHKTSDLDPRRIVRVTRVESNDPTERYLIWLYLSALDRECGPFHAENYYFTKETT
jgi:dATP/dGTP pyrophosphohydrolase